MKGWSLFRKLISFDLKNVIKNADEIVSVKAMDRAILLKYSVPDY
jgi:hypothetical protein